MVVLGDVVAGVAGSDHDDFFAGDVVLECGVFVLTAMVYCAFEELMAREFGNVGLPGVSCAHDDVLRLHASVASIGSEYVCTPGLTAFIVFCRSHGGSQPLDTMIRTTLFMSMMSQN